MADLIPNDVLFDDIFLRLPVKSLLNCKCVCKTWNSVIKDPYFLRKHIRFSQRQRVLLQLNYQHDYISFDVGTGDTNRVNRVNRVTQQIKIVGSSNGLVCGLFGAPFDEKTLQIWNPSTGDLKLVRKGPSLRVHYEIDRFAFCYDSVENDYKIVHLNAKKSGHLKKVKFDIYSLKSDSWKIIRECDGISNLDGTIPTKRGQDVNGNIYWIVSRNYMFYDILVFNVRENKFRKLQLPRSCKRNPDHFIDLLVLGSSLGLYQYSSEKKSFLLWKLKENDEWIELMHITLPRYFDIVKDIRPVCLSESNEVVLLSSHKFLGTSSLHNLYDKLSTYNPIIYEDMSKTNLGMKILKVCGKSHPYNITQQVLYVESLVSSHTITRDDEVPKKKKRKRRNDDIELKGDVYRVDKVRFA